MCHKITVTKFRASSYGVAATVVVSKGKAVKKLNTRVIGKGIIMKEIAVPYGASEIGMEESLPQKRCHKNNFYCASEKLIALVQLKKIIRTIENWN